jgi:catechol 2,3-dioxygenase-like lactoylglutathione lyase family enzyme
MAIILDHTIVPAKDKAASASFFAEIFGLTVDYGYFARVQVNESLTLAFTDEPERWGNSGYDPGTGQCHHYAFHVSDADFERIFGRIKAKRVSYGSGPYNQTDGKIYTRRGGRGCYFKDPYGHLLEIMTVRETGSDF